VPDEPAPVGGLVASSGRITPDAHRAAGPAKPAATPRTLGPRTLAFREAQRRELLEAIRTPIVTTSLSGLITGFNAAAVALFGSPARLYGRGIREVLSFVPEPLELAIGDAQGRFADTTGRTVDLEVSRTVLQEAGDQGYAVYVVHDISRHAEVNRLREQLLYSVAHELRGPLMVLDNALEILDSDSPALTAAEFAQVLGTARRTSNRMRTLMEDLLSAGSIQSGHFVVAPRNVAVGDVLADALEIVNPSMDMRGQHVEIDVPTDAATVMADRRYARQVLSNLLANASKYSSEHSVIRVVARALGNMVRISVEDQGPGIAAAQQVGLFERFYRVRTDSDAPGVGLGLAIAKGIVEAHGGSIGIDSAPGTGTSVWFTLHAARPAREDGERSADPAR
jgi:PAS domain S-box-containing protein